MRGDGQSTKNRDDNAAKGYSDADRERDTMTPAKQKARSAATLWDDLRFRSAIVPYSVPEHFRLSPEEFFALMEAVKLLGRLNEWDALNPPTVAPYGDAPYWKTEMERVLAPFGNLRQTEDHATD